MPVEKMNNENAIEKELILVKKLLIGILVKLGATQKELGIILGINQSNISRMMDTSKIKSIVPNNK